MASSTRIEIKGQKELERAFLQLRREVLTELRPALRQVGEIVRAEAQSKAADTGNVGVRALGPDWSKMKLSITVKGVRVLAASRRSVGPPRPNFSTLVMGQAMEPALEENRLVLDERMNLLVDQAAARAGFL